MQADAKYTEAKSFSVNAKLLAQWCQRAAMSGKRFVLAVRIWNPSLNSGDDYAVIRLDDLAELLEKVKGNG